MHNHNFHNSKNYLYFLWNKDALVNRVDTNGNTPLMIAVIDNKAEIVKFLLDNGAHVNQEDNFGNTPLLIAVRNNNADIVKMLLDKGADVNQVDNSNIGLTPLLITVRNNNADIVQILLDKGALVNQADINGQTPLLIAVEMMCYNNNIKCNQGEIDTMYDIIKMLFKKNPTNNRIKLLQNAIDFLGKINNDQQCFILKIIEFVKLLLESDPNILDNHYLKKLLIVALKNPEGNYKLIKMLLIKIVGLDNTNDKDKLLINSLQNFIEKKEQIILDLSKILNDNKKIFSIQSPSLYTHKKNKSLKIHTKLPSLPLDTVRIIYSYLYDHIHVVEIKKGYFVISYDEKGEQGNEEKIKVLHYLQNEEIIPQISNGGTRKKRKAFPRKTLSKKTRGKGKSRRTPP